MVKINQQNITWNAIFQDLTAGTSIPDSGVISNPMPNRIEYDSGSKYLGTDPARLRWKACTHEGIAPIKGAYSVPYIEPTNGHSYVRSGDSTTLLQGDIDYLVLPHYRALPWATTTAGVYGKFRDEVSGKISSEKMLPLAYLRDLWSYGTKIPKILATLEHLRREYKPRSWRDLVKKAAGNDLMYKFAVKPTFEDIIKTTSLFQKAKDHVEKLNFRNQAEWLPYKVTATGFKEEKTLLPGYPISNLTGYYSLLSYECMTVHCRAKVKPATSDISALSYALDASGLKDFASTAWDLMPYSFIVDWFVNIGGLTRSFDRYFFHNAPAEKLCAIEEMWLTLTRTCRFTLTHARYRRPGVDTGLVKQSNGGGVNATYFNRKPAPANASEYLPTSLSTGKLGLFQATTGLQLLVQRVL